MVQSLYYFVDGPPPEFHKSPKKSAFGILERVLKLTTFLKHTNIDYEWFTVNKTDFAAIGLQKEESNEVWCFIGGSSKTIEPLIRKLRKEFSVTEEKITPEWFKKRIKGRKKWGPEDRPEGDIIEEKHLQD